jgi:hypothetical protein
MGKQLGIMPIKGTIDNLTFSQTKDGYIVKKKTSINGNQIKTDPRFARVRENMSEFGNAGNAGKLIRTSISSLLQKAKDDKTTSRLVQTLKLVQKGDLTSARGQRKVSRGTVHLLQGFNFNKHAVLGSVLHASFASAIDRVTGAMAVVSSPFIPGSMITPPQGATHYKILCAGVELDFDNDLYTTDSNETVYLPIDNNSSSFNLAVNAPANSTHALMLVLGIQFFELVNGAYYALNNGAFNSLSVVKAS